MQNVILLVYDSVRPDFLGCYGRAGAGTDEIDALAEEGALFETVISSSAWTLPSISALVSGTFSHKLGLFRWEQEWPADRPTLFHYLTSAGYDVGSFVFDEKYLFSNFPAAGVLGHSRDIEAPCDFIRASRDRPFFLFLHSWRTHIPWTPQSSAEAWRVEVRRLQDRLRSGGEAGVQECRSLYAESIRETSRREIPALRKAIESAGAGEDTVFVFTADHGESWAERVADKSTITDNFALHGRFLYDESIKVPLIIVPGESGWAGVRAGGQIRSVDIAPTILDLCGLDYDPEGMDGRSLVPVVDGTDREDRDALASTTDSRSGETLTILTKMAYRRPPWKMIWSARDGRRELYNIEDDPAELRDEYESFKGAASVEELSGAVDDEIKAAKPYEGSQEELDQLKDQLRGLGYL